MVQVIVDGAGEWKQLLFIIIHKKFQNGTHKLIHSLFIHLIL